MAYNITDGMMTAAPQLMRSMNGFNKVATKTDGLIDLYFGPQKPANVADSTGSRPPTAATSSSPFASKALASSSTIRAGSRTRW
jgi:hypothetical protein